MKRLLFLLFSFLVFSTLVNGQTYHNLSGGNFSQDWTNTGLITTNDNWDGVVSIIGYRGDDITTTTGVDPQTLLGEGTIIVDVNANQTAPNTFSTGGVTEFEISDPVVALTGSGAADAPNIIIFLNTTTRKNISVQYNLRDIDGSSDNAVQQVAVQYRIGATGDFTNIPAGYVADASSGPSLATLVTPVNISLPTAAENQSQVQVRIITSNAVGNDEWIGIDDIVISSVPLPIKISDFKIEGINKTAHISWQTSSETNNSHFLIEWSKDAKNWSEIGKKEGSGTTREMKNYSFIHENPASGTNYYRLTQVDFDGRKETFPVKSVFFASKGKDMSIIPTLAKDNMKIEFSQPVINGRLLIYNMDGRMINSYVLAEGIDILRIDVSDLLPGQYIAKYIDGEETISKKFIKQ